MFIHKFDVDSDRVYRELAQSEQHQGAILFYSSFEFVLSQALSSVSLLLSALLLFLGIALLFLWSNFVGPFEGKAAFYWAGYLLILVLINRCVRFVLPYILPKLWTSRIRQGYNWDEIHEDALAAINVDLIRSIDWRFDLILSRLNRGPRLCNPDLDFRYERITGPGFYPKLFIRFWVMRPLTGAILLLTAGLLAVNGWIFAHWCIAAPVYVVGIYIFFRILWAGFAGTLSQTRSLKLVTAFLEDSISANLERRPMLGMPDPTICRRLASALRAKNAASVDIFCRQFLTDVLAHVDKFQHRAVIDEQIIPILQKHFGNPLPKLLQDALDNYEFSD